jgi:hypothetical protein
MIDADSNLLSTDFGHSPSLDVPGVPQHDGVDDQAQGAEPVFLAVALGLEQLAASGRGPTPAVNSAEIRYP